MSAYPRLLWSSLLAMPDFDAPASDSPDPNGMAVQDEGAEPCALPSAAEMAMLIADLQAARAEIVAAREQGRIAGRVEAAQQARTERDGRQAALLAAIAAAMSDGREAAARVACDAAEGVAGTVLAALRAALPAACAAHGPAEVRALVDGLLPHLMVQPEVVVRVAPCAIDTVQAALDAADAETGHIRLVATEACAPDEVRVSWRNGAARRGGPGAWAAITGLLPILHIPSDAEETSHD